MPHLLCIIAPAAAATAPRLGLHGVRRGDRPLWVRRHCDGRLHQRLGVSLCHPPRLQAPLHLIQHASGSHCVSCYSGVGYGGRWLTPLSISSLLRGADWGWHKGSTATRSVLDAALLPPRPALPLQHHPVLVLFVAWCVAALLGVVVCLRTFVPHFVRPHSSHHKCRRTACVSIQFAEGTHPGAMTGGHSAPLHS